MHMITIGLCPCGTGQPYDSCCGLYIDQGQVPLSPEALMRSRYSAYTQAKIAYIVATMCGSAAVVFDPESAKHWAESCEWLRLEVLRARYHRTDSNQASVEFKAYYREQSVDQCLHEKSLFLRKNGHWFYYDRIG